MSADATFGPGASAPRRGPMAYLRDRKVRTKLLSSFSVVCVLLIVVGAFSISELTASRDRLKDMYSHRMKAVVAGDQLSITFAGQESDLGRLALADNPQAVQTALSQITAGDRAVEQQYAAYQAAHPAAAADLPRVHTDLAAFRSSRDAVSKLLQSGAKSSALDGLLRNMESAATKVQDDLDRSQAANDAEASSSVRASESRIATARTLIVVLVVIAVLLSIAMALLISNLITKPLQETVRVLKGLAAGKLNVNVDVRDASEIGAMGVALNESIARIRDLMERIVQTGHLLASQADQLTAVSAQVSSGAEESATQAGVVAAAAEQISSNVATVARGGEQMGSAIRQIAGSTSEATEVAGRASASAQAANSTVAKLGE